MKSRPAAFLLLLLTATGLWLATSHRPEPVAARPVADGLSSPEKTSQPPATPSRSANAAAKPNENASPDPAASATETKPAAWLASPASNEDTDPSSNLAPGTALENMRGAFHEYHSRFGGNPVGTNPEITAALNGANPAHAVFLDPKDAMRINNRGELVDSWGTPYFFHQLSASVMEIRSAGPDCKLWTADDLVIK
jgi:hypothetical protein